jgi:hypothetical protein
MSIKSTPEDIVGCEGVHGVLNYPAMYNLAMESYLKKPDVRVGDCECIVRKDRTLMQYVAIRGTELKLISELGIIDMLQNIRALPWYDKRVGWSHKGFLRSAQGLVDKGLFGVLNRNIPISLVGHSYGGAVALNAAAILNAEGFKISKVVTIGAPRSFIVSSANRYNDIKIATFHINNEKDIVTNLPFKRFLRPWRFKHPGIVHIVKHSKSLTILESHSMDFYDYVGIINEET